MSGFYLDESLEKVDPDLKKIIDLEAARQNQKLIFIPSESFAPLAVRESLGSILQNIYAEGYPDEASRWFSEEKILDVERHLAHFQRYSDPRYYKGVEYADIIEELARRRCAEAFATADVSADDIYVNVQPLSGAPANNAVYQALIQPGDTILGMNLLHGGHLTHGSSVNRSGKLYNATHYSVDPQTEQIDYDEVERIAVENKPRVIITGFSSYPWVPDWARFRQIADKVGAYLMADVSHIAGMIAAGVLPSPVGYADVVTFTTHKTLCGPRGACILSFKESISKKIDKAVFPGEQGGPHIQVLAAMATTFKLAREEAFLKFQQQVVKNCKALSDQFEARGMRIAFGGTNTHLLNLDCKSVVGPDGSTLSGDMAARIMDLAGLVANSNAIPGDKATLRASGVRMGTPWLTQRGLLEDDMRAIADIIVDLLQAATPYTYKNLLRAKVDFQAFEQAKIRVRKITERAFCNEAQPRLGYPQFNFVDSPLPEDHADTVSFAIRGAHVRQSLNFLLQNDLESLPAGESRLTKLYVEGQAVNATLTCQDAAHYVLSLPAEKAAVASAWLRDLSDGFVYFDEDLLKRIPGPFIVSPTETKAVSLNKGQEDGAYKPYFVGIDQANIKEQPALSDFQWEAPQTDADLKTSLHATHVALGAKMVPFAGWDMPVWYSSVLEEHMATRNAAGLFDVSHMGVYQAEGPDALAFLDSVCANDISALEIGQSCYTHFLDPDANVIDDLLVYYHNPDEYLVVVNAGNDDKDWAWLNAVRKGEVKVDQQRPWARAFGANLTLKNLRDPKLGKEMRVDLALQGPRSRDILNAIGLSAEDTYRLNKLKRTELGHFTWNGLDLIISRTGYTGERMAFEIFIHPDKAPEFWDTLLKVGEPFGVKPCGLGARDSLRTEAGLPLYGHEMGGEMNLGVGEAGFGSYVKTYKPWFIGRAAFLQKEAERSVEVIRFQFEEKRVRMAHNGDLVLNERGKVIGQVTSCAINKEEYLTGQACLDTSNVQVGTPIYIYQNTTAIKDIAINDLKKGSKLQLPDKAIVVSRFPKL
ncbi:MAG: glycine hydroxymethyltransferase [Chloroflexota bacterium]|nr:glycine hydroxymethyltransferase [Chloroflexota bacterium]